MLHYYHITTNVLTLRLWGYNEMTSKIPIYVLDICLSVALHLSYNMFKGTGNSENDIPGKRFIKSTIRKFGLHCFAF